MKCLPARQGFMVWSGTVWEPAYISSSDSYQYVVEAESPVPSCGMCSNTASLHRRDLHLDLCISCDNEGTVG